MSSATDQLTADSTRLLDDLVAELTDHFRAGDFDALDRFLNEHPC